MRRDGSALFGVLQLAYGESPDGRAALGLRTGNDRTMSIQLCAGLSVFVCDNLAFRGDMIALKRRHTSALNLRVELAGAVLRFQDHFGRRTGEIANLKERLVSDTDAKAILHDVFVKGILPIRLLPEASTLYFGAVRRRVQAQERLEPAQRLYLCRQGDAHHHADAGNPGAGQVLRDERRWRDQGGVNACRADLYI